MNELGLFDFGVLAAHCVHLSEADIAILKARKVRVAHNPGSNMKLASGAAPVPALLAAGVTVGLGTDGASSNNNLDMVEELRLAALLNQVFSRDPLAVPAGQAVAMATAHGAAALGLGGVTGELAPGRKADIAISRHDRLPLVSAP
jgi:5-methylthioadenosine/S-adenosylhomocysteine deaminase